MINNRYIIKEEKDYIKSYTKNNFYRLCGLYGGKNIFRYKQFNNTIEVFNFIISNINKLDNIPNIDVKKFKQFYYPLCNNTTMIIDGHNKSDIFKLVIDVDIKYDNEHLNTNKYKSLDEIDFNELYKDIPKYIKEIIEYYFEYNINNIDNEYIDYVLKYNDNNKDNIINPYEYIWSNKINNNSNIHLYFPFIFVNQNQYIFIIDKLINKLNSININLNWNKIIDIHMADNGFRLLYCNKPYYIYIYNKDTKIGKLIDKKIPHKPNYYLINYDKTTIKLNKNDKFHHLFITSMQTTFNTSIIINNNYINEFNDIVKKYKDYDKQINKKIKKYKNIKNKKIIKSIKKCIIKDIKNKDITNELNKVFNLLNNDRLEDYNKWYNLICLCHTYHLYNYSINLSKKSKKYDDYSLTIINETFNKKVYKKKTFRTLFYWIRQDYNITKQQQYNFLKDKNIDIKLLNEELQNYKCKYIISNHIKYDIKINDLIKLNIKDEIINNKKFNYYEVENEFINDNDFNYIKDYNNICLISPVGTRR